MHEFLFGNRFLPDFGWCRNTGSVELAWSFISFSIIITVTTEQLKIENTKCFNAYSHGILFISVWSLKNWFCQYLESENNTFVIIYEASAALSASCGAPAIPAESLCSVPSQLPLPCTLSVIELEEKPCSSLNFTKYIIGCTAVLWEERIRDFQQPWPLQFDFLLFTVHPSQTGYSPVVVCHVVCFRATLHRLSALRMSVLEGSLGCLQNCCGLVTCVCKKFSISMPSVLAVQTNLHQIFNIPQKNYLYIDSAFHWVHVIPFYYFVLILLSSWCVYVGGFLVLFFFNKLR